MTIRHLDLLLTPGSVAVFGASRRPGSVGATVWRNLRAGRFAGPVYAVNPKYSTLDGVPVSANAAHLPEAPELALLCTPAHTIAPLVAELANRGTRAAVIMTAGLSDSQKRAVLDASKPCLMRLLGPNCIGLLSPHVGLNASFAHTDALPGEIAFVSQSGALVTAMLDWARSRGIGLSHMVSIGDSLDVDFGDLLDYLGSDSATRAILLYIESVQSPRKFMSAARAAARNKPVIVVKAGRTEHGLRAAASHTGALAGADAVYDAAIRRAGMLRVDTLQALFTAAETLARFRENRDEVLTILTNGGGAGVLAADAAERTGIQLAAPGAALLDRLSAQLPASWSHGNPVDILGDAPVERYTAALSAVLGDPSSGAVLFLHAPTAIVRSDDIARACLPLIRAAAPRVMSVWLGGSTVAGARQLFEEAGVPDYPTPEEAVQAFGMLQTYRRNQDMLMETPATSESSAPDGAKARSLLDAALSEGREWLGAQQVRDLLQAYGIPVVPTTTVPLSPEAVFTAARELSYPVAVKIASQDIPHKSDVGGVRLGIHDASSLGKAIGEMLSDVKAARPDAHLEGFIVQPMVVRPNAHELIVGATIDSVFGPVIACGQGGTAVEVAMDSAAALPPLNRSLARELVSRMRVSRLLAGYRNRPAAHVDALYDVLIAVSQMLADLPGLAELDINPLLVDERGVLALDARVRISKTEPAGAEHFAILPYPSEWVRNYRWNGRTITIRPIRPEDEPRHRQFLEGLAPDDLRLRFFLARPALQHSELARMTQIDYDREMAFIVDAPGSDGGLEMLGIGRTVCDPDRIEAEFALVVRSDLKGVGLGTLLLGQLIEHARSRGVIRLAGVVLRENTRMLALAHAMGFVAAPVEKGDGSIRRVVKVLNQSVTHAP